LDQKGEALSAPPQRWSELGSCADCTEQAATLRRRVEYAAKA
jgi:hypothetical protein